MCFSRGQYPSILKKATVTLIFKQRDHTQYTNYRPIAILSEINKIVEEMVVSQVSEFLEQHQIPTDTQHSFRHNRSTATALPSFSEYINNCLDLGHQVLALFVDYNKKRLTHWTMRYFSRLWMNVE